ncbi:MAG TPA: hypothetical protein PLF40_31900, partial [Kofleriaceae bacterium]|nr:hypothetical protein [Kofleriaceae bacterium]
MGIFLRQRATLVVWLCSMFVAACGDDSQPVNQNQCQVVSDGNDCTIDACINGVLVHTPLQAGSTCGTGGNVCDDAARCVECFGNAGCTGNQYCSANNTCVAATCTDGMRNGSEGDVDCGGTCATRCSDGATCASAGDCSSGVCANNGSGLHCAAPTCGDNVVNGTDGC